MLIDPSSVRPMEAKPAAALPEGGGWLYEPKWDGFRCLVFKDGNKVDMRSKRGTRLDRYFPELAEGFRQLRPKTFALDGEVVIVENGGLSFEKLQLRLHPAESRIKRLAQEIPATFMAFDCLADPKGKDLRSLPLERRRKQLESFVGEWGNDRLLLLSPATREIETARGWLDLVGNGMDGVVAKRLKEKYQEGKRAILKIKVWRSVDCVVAGFFEDARGHIEELLLGLYDEKGKLHYAGRCPPPMKEAELRKKLDPLVGGPGPGSGFSGRQPTIENRWSKKKRKIVRLKPKYVVEVSADHVTGGHMRHGSRFIRWRPDKKAKDCSLDQFEGQEEADQAT
jgi:ATP-dependent DNA ligase